MAVEKEKIRLEEKKMIKKQKKTTKLLSRKKTHARKIRYEERGEFFFTIFFFVHKIFTGRVAAVVVVVQLGISVRQRV